MFSRHFTWIFGTALAGVVAGHSLTYAATAPNRAERDGLLALTGHSYWQAAVLAGVMLGMASLFVVVLRHFRAGLVGASSELPGAFGLGVRLSGLQLVLFTAIEALERMSAHQSLSSLMEDNFLPTGLVIQLFVAFIAAGLLRWLARAAEAFGSALRTPFAPSPSLVFASQLVSLLGGGRICETGRGRGPPAGLLPTT